MRSAPALVVAALCLAAGAAAIGACNSVLGIPLVDRLAADSGIGGTGGCATGQKSCDGGCVSVLDPAAGCGGDTCAPCAFPHALAGCVTGACAIDRCELGFGDCDGIRANGCEADLANDPMNCSDCKIACAASFSCVQRACVCTTNASCLAAGTCDVGGGTCTCNGTACAPGAPCDEASGNCAF